MNRSVWIRIWMLFGVVLFVGGCEALMGPKPVNGDGSTVVASAVAEVTEPIRSYRAILHQEVQHPQPNGTEPADILEFSYEWTATDGPFGYDAHAVTTLLVPQSPTPGVMDEAYASGGSVYQLSWNGWSKLVRTGDVDGRSGVLVSPGGILPNSDVLAVISGLPVATLLAASTARGEELVGGLRATHYQLTDVSLLTGVISARLALPPPPTQSPLTIDSAQFDIWVGVKEGLPVQYILSAVGKVETSAGSGVSVPFVIADRYTVGEVNGQLVVVVPPEVLAAAQAR